MNKYAQTYLSELSKKVAAPGSMTSMGVPYTSNGGLYGRGGLFNPSVASPGVPPSRRGNYVGNSSPSILGSAAKWFGNQFSSAANDAKSYLSNPLVNPLGAAAGWLGKQVGNSINRSSGGSTKGSIQTIGKPLQDMGKVTSSLKSAPLRVEQVPNGEMIMPSQKQMIDEGKMDLINYEKGNVSESPTSFASKGLKPAQPINKNIVEQNLRNGKYKLLDDKGNPVEIPPLY